MAFLTALKEKLFKSGTKKDSGHNKGKSSQVDADTQKFEKNEMTENDISGCNLMVACHDSRFPDEMVDYALEMAHRMNYGIIAVNAANLTHDVVEFFSTTHETLYQDFMETASKNIVSFRNLAERKGLRFAHVVEYSNIDHAMNDISKKYGQIEFVISENREQQPSRNYMENENRISKRLFVYSMN